jgi:hypothetical protein
MTTSIERSSAESARSGRCGFLKRITIALGTLAVWKGGSSDAKAWTYLTPSYLPPGFRLWAEYTNRDDGFQGGPSELALWYKNEQNPHGFNNPLSIYMAPNPRREELGNQQGPNPTHVARVEFALARDIAVPGRYTVSGRYYDGCWVWDADRDETVWDSTNAHALVFRAKGLMIGVAGSRVVGITFEELVRVASSLR